MDYVGLRDGQTQTACCKTATKPNKQTAAAVGGANLVPRVAEVVAVGVGHSDEGLDGVDVLLLHFGDARAGGQQGEPRQGLHVRVPLQLRPREKAERQNTARGTRRSEWKTAPTCMQKMHAILMAQRMPSRHSEATSVSSQSCRPTLKAARNGVHAS